MKKELKPSTQRLLKPTRKEIVILKKVTRWDLCSSLSNEKYENFNRN